MIERFHAAVVQVSDLEAGVADYTRLLGRAPVRGRVADGLAATESPEPDGTTPRAVFRLANASLELRAPPSPPPSEEKAVGKVEGEVEGEVEGKAPAREGLAGLRLDAGDAEPSVVAGWLGERDVPVASIRPQQALDPSGGSLGSWSVLEIRSDVSRGLPVGVLAGAQRAAGGPTGPRAGEALVPDAGPTALEAGAAPADPDAAVAALDHVVVLSAAPDATARFWGEGLGIRLALDRRFEARGVRLIFFRLAGVTIEIGGRLGVEPQDAVPDRFGGLAWRVPDLDAIHARLVAEGFDVSPVRDGHKPGTRVCTVREPVHDVPTLLIEPARGT